MSYADTEALGLHVIAIGCKYGIDLLKNSCVYVKEAVFAGTMTL